MGMFGHKVLNVAIIGQQLGGVVVFNAVTAALWQVTALTAFSGLKGSTNI